MSDFLFSTRRRPPRELRDHLACFLSALSAEIVEYHGDWGSLAVARSSFDHLPVVHEGHHLSVVIGEPVLHGEGTSAPLDEARRRALHERLTSDELGPTASTLDGHFAVLTLDTTTGCGALLTDRFCFVGVFHASEHGTAGDALVLGTHVESVARAAGRGENLDLISAADLALHLVCTFPWTLYDGVAQALPGAARRFSGGRWTGEPNVYWAPTEEPAYSSLADAAEALREGIRGDVRAATNRSRDAALLLSGGEDSRAVLGALPPDKRVRAIIYADWESREVRIARRVARAYDAELVLGRRAPDHYLAGFETVASAVGSAHLFSDVHGFGLHERLSLGDYPVVLGGLSADSLLKATYSPTSPTAARTAVPPPDAPAIRRDLRVGIGERRTAIRERLARLRPRSAAEWSVLWPFSMRKHGGNVEGNRRLFRSHEVYHATAVLDVAARTRAEWKKGRRLFLTAARPLLRRSWYVPHAEYRFPYFGRGANVVLVPFLALARGARALTRGETRARHRPWPKWGALADSDAMRGAERAHPLEGSPVAEIFEPMSAADREQAVRAWPALNRLMLLQLSFVSAKTRS